MPVMLHIINGQLLILNEHVLTRNSFSSSVFPFSIVIEALSIIFFIATSPLFRPSPLQALPGVEMVGLFARNLPAIIGILRERYLNSLIVPLVSSIVSSCVLTRAI